jgi:hypothetical protein
MISDMASLLKAFLDNEAVKIAGEGIGHGPTIGDMYEGLARETLSRTIPGDLNIRIEKGFIKGVDGELSTQIDCMLVTGDGHQLPYTDSYVWSIRDVLAVIEIKKNLYGRELKDAFEKQHIIREMFKRFWGTPEANEEANLPRMLRTFSQGTGIHVNSYADGAALPDDLSKFLFHYLVCELVQPLQIIFGFEGYSDEHALRMGVAKLIEESADQAPIYTPFTLPVLVICRHNSVLKLNGFPYVAPVRDGWWQVLASNSENPLRILIELIWAKLENTFFTSFPEDNNLQMERFALLAQVQLIPLGDDKFSWIYEFIEAAQTELDAIPSQLWSPHELKMPELVMAQVAYNKGFIDIRDDAEMSYFTENDEDPKAILQTLVDLRLLSLESEFIGRPTHSKLQISLDRGGMFATGATDLYGEWVTERIAKRKIVENN